MAIALPETIELLLGTLDVPNANGLKRFGLVFQGFS
jgi:hypothetical protein